MGTRNLTAVYLDGSIRWHSTVSGTATRKVRA